MTQQIIDIGAAPNDGQGDPIRTAFEKTNNNFTQLFASTSLPNTIVNGTSNVNINTANGNITLSVANVSNVVVVTSTSVSAPSFIATQGVVYNSNTITGNNVVGAGLNGLSVGPLSMDGSATMSLPSGQRWLVM